MRLRAAPSAAGRQLAPPATIGGFLVLLALMFVAAYGAGALAGPVNPQLHPVNSEIQESGGGGQESGHGGGMDGMR